MPTPKDEEESPPVTGIDYFVWRCRDVCKCFTPARQKDQRLPHEQDEWSHHKYQIYRWQGFRKGSFRKHIGSNTGDYCPVQNAAAAIHTHCLKFVSKPNVAAGQTLACLRLLCAEQIVSVSFSHI